MVATAQQPKRKEIRPQAGFQTAFLSTPADIAIGGGSAGGGKTYAELMEAMRNTPTTGFDAIIFRRTYQQIKTPGGLWDNSLTMYSQLGGVPNQTNLYWTFPSGAKVKMSNLEYENDVYNHQGGQYALIIFDELTHFTRKMFFYLLSRNRSTCGVRPYIRATTNPDPDSWVAEFISWWINKETGLPIPERAGKLRYMLALDEAIVWADSKAEVIAQMSPEYWEQFPADIDPNDLIKSVTFIPGSIYENKELLSKDPGYLANLLAQDEGERARLLEGNWKIRTDGLGVYDPLCVRNIFSNHITDTLTPYITCDAARFGRDLMVIFSWQGWRVVRITIAHKSDERMIVDAIERERKAWQVPKTHTLVDQDGVGGGTVALGGYVGFSGGAAPMEDPETHEKENYLNLKTQCYYRSGNRVNVAGIQIVVTSESVVVLEESGREIHGTQIRVGGKVWQIADLIERQLRAIKKSKPDNDGKKRINDKAEQKAILGMSPDFSDTLMMREFFELKGTGRIAGNFRKAFGAV